MSALKLTPNLTRHDDLYEQLVALHAGLPEADSLKIWARLVLILMNEIRDAEVILAAIKAADPR